MSERQIYELKDVRVRFISFVNRAANKRGFLTAKRIGEGRIISAGGGIVSGIVYEPDMIDSQGCYMTAEEVRKAAHWYARNGSGFDVGHSFLRTEGATILESYIAPCDMEIAGEGIAAGTWLITAEITDDKLFQAIERGEITGFSMGGTGRRVERGVAVKEKANETLTAPPPAARSTNIEAMIQRALAEKMKELDARISESVSKSMEPYMRGVAANHGGDESAPQHYLAGIL